MAINPAMLGLKNATPGMLGTGGADPSTDPLGIALHQRALQHSDDYYQQQDEFDRANPGSDPMGMHKSNELQSRINNMNPGGWGDWIYAFNEATGGKGKFAPGTTFTGNTDTASPNNMPLMQDGKNMNPVNYGDVRQYDSALPQPNPAVQGLKRVR